MASQLPIPRGTLPNRSLVTLWSRSCHMISPEADPVLEWLRRECIWRTEQMNVVRHDDIATYTPEIRSLPCCDESSGRILVRQQRSSPVRAHRVRKIMIDRNPTSSVEKCAGFFRSRRRTAFGGVAELRPPSESVFTALVWFRLLPTCECAFRCMAIES